MYLGEVKEIKKKGKKEMKELEPGISQVAFSALNINGAGRKLQLAFDCTAGWFGCDDGPPAVLKKCCLGVFICLALF